MGTTTRPTPGRKPGTGKTRAAGSRVVTLTTDFGHGSPYVAAIKGVLLTLCPDVRIVDISHDVPALDIAAGAFMLMAGTRHFPRGCVHLAVVDPGVGTLRQRLAVAAGGSYYVGPDNGVLTLAVDEAGLQSAISLPLPAEASATFEGRDVFAPAAAELAKGTPLKSLGPSVAELQRIHDVGTRVLWVDGFGNLVTNVRPPARALRVHRHNVVAIAATYGDAMPREPFVYVGSMGYLEIGVREGRADQVLGARAGNPVEVL